jgi:hypothetical protein
MSYAKRAQDPDVGSPRPAGRENCRHGGMLSHSRAGNLVVARPLPPNRLRQKLRSLSDVRIAMASGMSKHDLLGGTSRDASPQSRESASYRRRSPFSILPSAASTQRAIPELLYRKSRGDCGRPWVRAAILDACQCLSLYPAMKRYIFSIGDISYIQLSNIDMRGRAMDPPLNKLPHSPTLTRRGRGATALRHGP